MARHPRRVGTIVFPDPRDANEDGIVAAGGEPRPNFLLAAYSRGIFPWPVDGYPLLWFSPPERGVLFFDELHVPRSLARARRRTPLRFSVDEAFGRVIQACADIKRVHEDGTWITPAMIRGYRELHALGHAHSVEAWEGDELVGGIYGVDAGGAFGGESMFRLRPNASKLALLHLVDHLRERGVEWLDVQVITPHVEALGARLIPRDEFLELLAAARERGLKLF
jgi:leucyl/phenylalanyl-tRNA--protein transferase